MVVTFFFAVFGGLTGGFVASLSIWQPVKSLYRDDDHIVDVAQKYPSEYTVGGDIMDAKK